MRNAINTRASSNRAKASGVGNTDAEGHALVGFGPYGHMTRKALYESMAEDHKRYVKDLMHHPVTHPGSQLDKLKKYLEKKVEEERKDDQDLAQIAAEIEQRVISGRLTCIIFLHS